MGDCIGQAEHLACAAQRLTSRPLLIDPMIDQPPHRGGICGLQTQDQTIPGFSHGDDQQTLSTVSATTS